MSIVPIAEIESFIGITEGIKEEAGQATDTLITSLHSAVEKFVKTFCRKDIEQTDYTKEIYYANSRKLINLKNYPVISVDRVAVGKRDVLQIRNTNEWTSSSVSVSSTGLRLMKDGAADETVLFATYTTLSDVITAVNLISGWEAQLLSGVSGTIPSSELVDRYAANTINNNWIYLEIPESAEMNIEVFPNEGQIIFGMGGSYGYDNYFDGYFRKNKSDYCGSNVIYVDYSAGYTAANMPEDIKLAVKIMFKSLYEKRDQSSFGMEGYTISRVKIAYEKGIFPKEAIDILNRYKKVRV